MATLRILLPLLAVTALSAQGPSLHLAEPAQAGCDANGLLAATKVVADTVAADDLLGAVLMVVRGRTIVLHEALGHRDIERKLPMEKDTLFRMASNTKAVTAAAVLALVDDGKVGLDDPVVKWMPTFADGAAAKITVRHLLNHTSGLRIESLFLRPLMEKSEEHPDAPNLVLEAARFGEVGPKVEPGTTYSYSNPGYNTLAALVEVASGEGFDTFCEKRFYEPLGMRDSCHHETVADGARMSAVVRKDKKGEWQPSWVPGGKPTVPFVRGSGGMISTSTDFARFCRMLLDGGRCGDQRVLSAESVRAATTSQTQHLEKVRYGFGWRVGEHGRISHGGSDGTWAWCDAKRDLIGIIFTQTQAGAEVDKKLMQFRDLVTEACPPL